jgi:hypothetical protein
MSRSLRYYTEGLGFTLKHTWTPDSPEKIRWCWLELGAAALMLQERLKSRIPAEKLGQGVSRCFMCEDAIALYHEFKARGIEAAVPFVGNSISRSVRSATPMVTASTSSPSLPSLKELNYPTANRSLPRARWSVFLGFSSLIRALAHDSMCYARSTYLPIGVLPN